MTAASARSEPRLRPGAVVRCRTRRYLVEDVQPPMHRKLPAGGDRVVTLACMEDDAIGQRLTVFLGSEVDFEPLAESSWEAVTQRGFDQTRQFSAYLSTLRWNCVTATMSERERRQLVSDQKHRQRRMETIKAELSSEPKRIEASYRVVTHRLEPAGLVYLWPISG